MTRVDSSALVGALVMMLGAAAWAQTPATCDDASNRCTSTARLVTEGDAPFATISLQVSRTGADPVLYVVAPLGIAARPGVRIVVNPGAVEIALPLDVCFPDGCRASTELTQDQLSRLVTAQDLSIQFIPFSSEETVAGEVAASALVDPLTRSGVSLP